MELFIDTAKVSKIKQVFDNLPLTGVTTNPTLLSKEPESYIKTLLAIREVIGEEKLLHIQVVGETYDEMLEFYHELKKSVGGKIVIKVPVTTDGLKLMTYLKNNEDILVTATAIFTANQALLAAFCGVDYVAPYVNRIDKISGNGVQVVREIVCIFEENNLDCKVLAASFKNSQQVKDVLLTGCQSLTVSAEILEEMADHPCTNSSIKQFELDWKKLIDSY